MLSPAPLQNGLVRASVGRIFPSFDTTPVGVGSEGEFCIPGLSDTETVAVCQGGTEGDQPVGGRVLIEQAHERPLNLQRVGVRSSFDLRARPAGGQ